MDIPLYASLLRLYIRVYIMLAHCPAVQKAVVPGVTTRLEDIVNFTQNRAEKTKSLTAYASKIKLTMLHRHSNGDSHSVFVGDR
jgi:hypothetical protein